MGLQVPFGASVSGGKNPVPNSKRAGLRGDRAGDGRVQMNATRCPEQRISDNWPRHDVLAVDTEQQPLKPRLQLA